MKRFVKPLAAIAVAVGALTVYFVPAVSARVEYFLFGRNADLPPYLEGFENELEEQEGEDFLEKRNEYFALLRGVDAGKPFDPQDRVRGIRQMERQERELRSSKDPARRAALLSDWTQLGPNPIPNGQTNSPRSDVSGRTVAIAVQPDNPNIVYVGAAQGGLYRTLDAGAGADAVWSSITDGALSLSSGAVTHVPISAGEPSTVWYGTGEASFSSDGYFGVGLYRIRGANTANPVLEGPFNRDALGNDIFTGSSISEILVDPTDPNRMFISTQSGIGGIGPATQIPFPERGIYRTFNGLSASPTFEKIDVDPAMNNGDRSVSDLVADPADFNRLIAAVVDRPVCPQPLPPSGVCPVPTVQLNDGGVYLSTNALSPTPTFTRSFATGATTSSSRTELALHRSASGTVTVYAASGLLDGTVHRSTDGGATFAQRVDNNFCSPQCFYDIGINVDPNDANRVYLAGSPTLAFATSTDGGAAFTQHAAGLHVDSHVIAVSPSSPSIMYFGSDGGIYRSVDAGNSWTEMNNSSYHATQFVSVAVHPTDPKYSIGGTQDNGTNMYRADGTWVHIQDGDGGYTAIDSNAANNEAVIMYHTFYNARQADILTPNTGAQITYEVTTSTTLAEDMDWVFRGCRLGVPQPPIMCTDNTLFYAPLELGPGVPNTVYFGSDRLYRSADTGSTHTIVGQAPVEPIGTPVPPNPQIGTPISAIAVAPQNDNVRIVGMRSGGVYGMTGFGATTLDNLDPTNTIPDRFIARVAIDPSNAATAYVTLSAFGVPGVWKTTSLGSLASGVAPTWTAASTGLPQVPVSAFVIDPVDPNRLYAGTDIGVYTSLNGGGSWTPFGSGLPRVAVFDMAITNAAPRQLRIATHGRGLWQAALPAPSAANVSISGRAVRSDDNGISGARVTLTDASGATRIAVTNPFGQFNFDDVRAGETYVLSAMAKGLRFSPRSLVVDDELTGITLTPDGKQ